MESSASEPVGHALTFRASLLIPAWRLYLRDSVPIPLEARGRSRRTSLVRIPSERGCSRRQSFPGRQHCLFLGERAAPAALSDNVTNVVIESGACNNTDTACISFIGVTIRVNGTNMALWSLNYRLVSNLHFFKSYVESPEL